MNEETHAAVEENMVEHMVMETQRGSFIGGNINSLGVFIFVMTWDA